MKQRKFIYLLQTIVIMIGLTSCATIPKGVIAVTPFDTKSYLGKWYEIARIDFKYERDLNNTTASYSLKSNGVIKVDNQGYNTKKGKWEQAIGKAKFVGKDTVAMLKVSFFGPFYSGYNVIALDANYKYALIAGASHKYLWILSREPRIPDAIKNNYLTIAKNFGYHTSDLIWIEHDKKK